MLNFDKAKYIYKSERLSKSMRIRCFTIFRNHKYTLREEILVGRNFGVRSICQIRNNLAAFILADREKNLIWRELILADSTNNLFFKKGFDRKKKQSTLNGKKKTPM